MKVLQSPVVTSFPLQFPTAVLLKPVVLDAKDTVPTAVLPTAVVLDFKAQKPTATLFAPYESKHLSLIHISEPTRPY